MKFYNRSRLVIVLVFMTIFVSSYTVLAYSKPLENGMKDKDVVQLKQDLKKAGFPVPGNGTTLFGKDTEAKVKAFQSYYGITANGIANTATFNQLNKVVNSPLQNGKRHNDTKKLKADLKKIGYPVPGNGTNLYGKDTEAVVKKFQKDKGLVVNGIADSITLAKIAALVKEESKPTVDPNNLKNGDRHARVKDLKRDLAKAGFPVPGNGTTLFGDDTEAKVKAFQSYYGITINGVANTTTFNELNKVVNSPLQNGKKHNDTKKLKADLKKVGYPVPGKGTTLYGKDTEAVVKKFQKEKGLVVNGIADSITLAKIAALVKEESKPTVDPNNLKNGDRHARVKDLKRDLAKAGFSVPGNGTTLFGDDTEAKVKAFQSYYGITANGVANTATFNQLNKVVNSPLQNGKRHNDTKKLKADLAKIGYPVPGTGTTLYGKDTETVVKRFQKDKNLVVNGIADEVTLAKIKELVDKIPTKPGDKTEYTDYKLTLNKALDIQMNQKTIITDKYKSEPAYVSSQYIKLDSQATITGTGVNIRTEPNTTSKIAKQVDNGYKFKITKEVQGTRVSGSTLWYEFKEGKNTYYVHSSLASSNSGIATANVNVRANTSTSAHIYGTLAEGSKVTIIETNGNWYRINYTTWRNPTRNDMEYYLNPNNNDKMQHLRLDSSVDVNASQLNNNLLKGKGVLEGKGQTFINTTKKHGVNEAYLISHSTLETGNGTSILSDGSIEVGELKKNQYVTFIPKNSKEYNAYVVEAKYSKEGVLSLTPPILNNTIKKSDVKNRKRTYNMYGIRAIDGAAAEHGSVYAYIESWFTPEAAIEGGAEWIAKQYIQNEHKQNTLYKMKWNPNMYDGYAWKQYATDIGWAVKQIAQIEKIYKELDNPNYHYDIAKYK